MTPYHEQNTNGSMAIIREFFFIFLPFILLFAIVAFIHYYNTYRSERLTIETGELMNVGLARSALNKDLTAVNTDLRFIASYIETDGFDNQGRIRQNEVTRLLKTFISQKKLYDQIRLIDLDGQEQVRINYRDGNASIVAAESLQNKASRYYFRETIILNSGEVYISPLDLNIEQGKVERPFKPVIRFAIPIFSETLEKRGILVFNYLGQRMLANFRRAAANIADHIHLLNSDGYWLHAPNDKDAWGFMLHHNSHFGNKFKQEWQEINKRTANQFRTEKGLFTFESVTPLSVVIQPLQSSDTLTHFKVPKEAERWYIVANVSPENDVPTPWVFFKKNAAVYLLLFFIVIFGSWLLALTRLKHRMAVLEGEYEKRFRHTLENMELAAVNVDLDNRIRFCNNSFLRLTSWQREEVLGQQWIKLFVTPQRHEYVTNAFENLKKNGTFLREVEAEIITRYGKNRLMSWHNTLSFDSDGKVSGITAIGQDITEKRQAEAQVRKLSRAVENSPSIVMLTDNHGCIEYVNPKFTQVTGYTQDEVIGKNPNILKSGETSADDYQSLWKTVISGKVWRGEFHNRRKNGELYWEAASISALTDKEGNITNFIAVKEDITEHKRLEQEIKKQNAELARHQALSAMGRMAGMIAHDLRNPLSSVKMSFQILGRQASEEYRELQEIGMSQVLYMENILTDMLAYARPDIIKNEWIDIAKLLESIITSVQHQFESQSIVLSREFDKDLPYVPGDPDKLRRLFSNLISNAIQALSNDINKEEKKLLVNASIVINETITMVKIDICDNGIGLQGVEIDKLFEPFFTTTSDGTGLGLPIVQQIVEQHNGTVDLVQNHNGDTCAIVILPTTKTNE